MRPGKPSKRPARKPSRAPQHVRQALKQRQARNELKKETLTGESSEGERVQKLLARDGMGSRREIEGWITDGRISINGRVVALGARVKTSDVVRVDGRRISVQHEGGPTRVLAYNKPEGEICTRHDPEGRATVFDRLPRLRTGRWISVGRLDVTTQGLLLFTNDGELAHRLTHPSFTLEREYAVRVLGLVAPEAIARLCEGVTLEDGIARFTSLRDAGGDGANHWYHVTLNEGRNREVHRLWLSQGIRVSRLVRVRYGTVKLAAWVKAGRFIELERPEILPLLETVSLERPLAGGSTGQGKKPPRAPRFSPRRSRYEPK
ncbi:MAG: 23S rRNA pseudouridine2605 synthase [Gammaproteobacteria bacterium]|jgi:23S rRNA pseudouridine2605 synthase